MKIVWGKTSYTYFYGLNDAKVGYLLTEEQITLPS